MAHGTPSSQRIVVKAAIKTCVKLCFLKLLFCVALAFFSASIMILILHGNFGMFYKKKFLLFLSVVRYTAPH